MTIEDISDITGLSPTVSKAYARIYATVLMHELAGEVLSHEDGRLEKTELYLPGLGTLKVKFVHTKKRKYEFIPDQDFDRGLLKVWRTGNSPLIPLLEKSLVDRINTKYNGLL